MNALSRPLPNTADASIADASIDVIETTEQRLARHAGYFREVAEMNLEACRTASAAVTRAHQAGEDASKPTLDLSRATRGMVIACNAENATFRKEPEPRAAPAPAGPRTAATRTAAPRAAASDTRRAPLCGALLKAAKNEPDPARRSALKRDIPVRVEAALVADPDAETPIQEHLFTLAEQFELVLDLAKLPDALLGIPPRVYIRDG